MKRVFSFLVAFSAVLIVPIAAHGFGGGATGYSTSGCTPCHGSGGTSITTTITCPSTATPNQAVSCTVSVNGTPSQGGGFNVSATSGAFTAGSNSRVASGEITHNNESSRTWIFTWTAPSAPGIATLRAVGLGSNNDGTGGGDVWDLDDQMINVGGGGGTDTDGDTTPDASDCAPNNPAIHPGATENCSNGLDDDCDNLTDSADPDCAGSPPGAIVLGNVAPRGNPDSVIDVGDAVVVLQFAVGMLTPTAQEAYRSDVGPGSVTNPGANPPVFTPAPDGRVDIGDAVVVLRAASGLIQIAQPGSGCTDPLPTANAGADRKVVRGSTVTLDGSGSADADTYAWSIVSKPAGSLATLSSATAVQPSFTADLSGDYTFQLVVTNCKGSSTADTVKITAADVVVSASVDTANYNGADLGCGQRILSGRQQFTVNFGGTGCRLKGDQSAGYTALTYKWEQIGGPPVVLSSTTAPNPTLTAPSLADVVEWTGDDQWGVLGIAYGDLELALKLTVTAGSTSVSQNLHIYLEDGGYDVQPRTPVKNVGLGTRVYLEGAMTEADGDLITGYDWSVMGPSGNPIVSVRDATRRVPSFLPMATGLYTVDWRVTAVTANGGDGLPNDSGSFWVTSARYATSGALVGPPARPACGACHNGVIQPDKTSEWLETGHAGKQFAILIGPAGAGSAKTSKASIAFLDAAKNPAAYDLKNPSYCWRCHLGWNTLPTATNGGLDDQVLADHFELPAGGTTFDWLKQNYPAIAERGGQQCESCHGPGGQHDGNLSGNAMGSSLKAVVCGQCHRQDAEWKNSGHAVLPIETSSSCLPCHSAQGYIRSARGESVTTPPITGHEVATCAMCHDPHSDANPAQLRRAGSYTMPAGKIVEAGAGATCLACHNGRVSDPEASARSSYRSAHYNQQGPILEGVQACVNFSSGAITFTENSFHTSDSFILGLFTGNPADPQENNKCVTCHQTEGPAEGQPGWEKIGGHSAKMAWAHPIRTVASSATLGPGTVTAGTSLFQVPGASFLTTLPAHAELVIEEGTGAGEYEVIRALDNQTLVVWYNFGSGGTATVWRVEEVHEVQLLAACAPCHSGLTEFDRLSRADYDGNGVIEGYKEEIRGLMDILASKCIAVDVVDVGGARVVVPTTWVPGGVMGLQSGGTVANTSNDVLYAVWNYRMVFRDGSMGVHNAAFTIQLLQKTYTALSLANPTVDDPNTPQNDAGKTFTQAYPLATIR